MRVFLRTFNDGINSKTGSPLPPDAPRRGTPEWLVFQKLLIDCLEELGHETFEQLENPIGQDKIGSWHECADWPPSFDKRIYVHQTKREKPDGDLFWMQMHCKELFTIDTQGWGADHSQKCTLPELNASSQDDSAQFCEVLSDKLYSSGESKCRQEDILDTTPNEFILVPTQIPRDYTIKNHSPITVRYFIDSLINWANETEHHLCFKLHPHSQSDIDLQMAVDEACASSEYIHRVRGNIHGLIRRSSGLFVINSGTGFEALIHGKPVATFGACDYSAATFNADIRRLDEAGKFIHSYKDEWRRIGYQFVKWYWTVHAYDVNASDTKERLLQYLKEHL